MKPRRLFATSVARITVIAALILLLTLILFVDDFAETLRRIPSLRGAPAEPVEMPQVAPVRQRALTPSGPLAVYDLAGCKRRRPTTMGALKAEPCERD